MKHFKQILFIGLVIILGLTSCTIEKRHYMSGYNIEWRSSKNYGDKKILAKINTDKKTKPTKKTIETIFDTAVTDNSTETLAEDNAEIITASSDNSVFIRQTTNKGFNKNSDKTILNKSKLTVEKTSVIKKIKKDKTNIYSTVASASDDDDDSNIALRVLGWLILIIGLLMLLFTSILLGLIVSGIGILFIALGKKKVNSSSQSKNINEDKPEYIDVVYLKNGGVIKGMIIEHTPNVQIKIQTKDGSIFVYKMEEIEKMTKELSK